MLVLALALSAVPALLRAQSAGMAASTSRSATAQLVDSARFANSVDSVFAPWRGTDHPGCVVGVSQRGRVVLERAYGMADVASSAPMSPSSVVHAASLAKQVTALSVLLLARDGKLSLDDDVRRWLPELASNGAPITVRQLLGHTSGLRDFFELLILGRGRCFRMDS